MGGDRVAPVARLEEYPQVAAEQALWWEQQVRDVLCGSGSLAAREKAKAAELAAAGVAISASGLRKKRLRYEQQGIVGLADGRAAKRMPAFGRVEQAVIEAMRQALAETVQDSTKTIGYTLWRTRQILGSSTGDVAVRMPSERTLYRLFAKLSAGCAARGSARTRQSVSSRPEGVFSEVPASAPGELVQIDSTPLDVLVRMDGGAAVKIEMTAVVDIATRTIAAAVLCPHAKSVDAAALMARAMVPEPMRPGWPEALAMANSALPYRRMLAADERLEQAAARPVIIPETVVCDHGRVFISHNFQAACRHLGISLQPAHKATPTDKGVVERTLGSVASLFAQYVAGYAGADPARRGRGLESGPLWSLPELQELLDEWIIASWQVRPHSALRDPGAPRCVLSPNQMYAALLESSGYIPATLSGNDYIELLPTRWQTVGAAGIRFGYRTYDGPELGPLRHSDSGIRERKGRWQVHYDPYDITRIWVRDRRREQGRQWITVYWKHLNRAPVPFGELAWDYARRQHPGADETQTADYVTGLLQRVRHGPQGRADQKIAARTLAARPLSHAIPDEPCTDDPALPEQDLDEPVVPLALFDPLRDPWTRT